MMLVEHTDEAHVYLFPFKEGMLQWQQPVLTFNAYVLDNLLYTSSFKWLLAHNYKLFLLTFTAHKSVKCYFFIFYLVLRSFSYFYVNFVDKNESTKLWRDNGLWMTFPGAFCGSEDMNQRDSYHHNSSLHLAYNFLLQFFLLYLLDADTSYHAAVHSRVRAL